MSERKLYKHAKGDPSRKPKMGDTEGKKSRDKYTSRDGDTSQRNGSRRERKCRRNERVYVTEIHEPRLGACCVNGFCTIQEERECLDNGGYWKHNTSCWPDGSGKSVCPGNPLGACATSQGCTLSTWENCPGMWMGPWTTCGPVLSPWAPWSWSRSPWGTRNEWWNGKRNGELTTNK